ncbi:SIS domain-containing protein [soil metagenome]
MRDDDAARALYPFLYPSSESAADLAGVLREASASILRKCRDIVALRGALLEEYADELVTAGHALAAAFSAGGKLLAFGNGGSATDAQDAATDCTLPALPGWRPLPALALVEDGAVLTAIANDIGVDAIFTRQLIAFGRAGDIALGISTSGHSANVAAALLEARQRGMLTVAFAGNDGGSLAHSGAIDHCFVARSEHIPRIQEGHATLWHALLDIVQARLAAQEAAA